MPSITKADPWWLNPKDPHRVAHTTQALLSPTLSNLWVFNPAYAHVQNEHVWQVGWLDIINGGISPQAAAEKAFNRIEEIFFEISDHRKLTATGCLKGGALALQESIRPRAPRWGGQRPE
jgi:hypothetical protein